jgi:fructan beta-fructosidase
MKPLGTFWLFSFLSLSLWHCQPAANQEQADTTQATGSYYTEPHRPQFHFSPSEKWMNDPNGMVYYAGEYHLFYQHYPDSTVWGPMHWGHAVSKDLVHWEHLPIALYPDSLGYIFSGSAVVDWNNTSGLGTGKEPPLIAIFTHHDPVGAEAGRNDFQYQSIAYSNDRGRSWTKYAGNPVVPNTEMIRDFRDPKVIWDEDSEQWVMVFAAYDHVKLYGSTNLIDWQHLSDWGQPYGEHGGVWECPDLFPITVTDSGEKKWVLLQSLNPGGPNGGSATQYFIGDFDGKEFSLAPSFEASVTDGKAVWLDYGRDNYAGVTWSDVPVEDGRRIFMGWMSNWDYATVVPTEHWRSAMTIARKLTLRKTRNGYRLFAEPLKELTALRTDAQEIESGVLTEKKTLPLTPNAAEFDLRFELLDNTADFGLELTNEQGEVYRIGYNAAKSMFYSDRREAGDHSFSDSFAGKLHTAPRTSEDRTIHFQLYLDVASAELFADEGATVMTDIFFPTGAFEQAALYVENGQVKLLESSAYSLKSIWQ